MKNNMFFWFSYNYSIFQKHYYVMKKAVSTKLCIQNAIF